MQYLDEVGHLAGMDKRKSADLGIARVFPASEDTLRFEGMDSGGKPWRVWMKAGSGVSSTDVWEADFDANGRPDLLISAGHSGNGRCVDSATITMLLFDGNGRPVPWHIETFAAGAGGDTVIPGILMDANGMAVPSSCPLAVTMAKAA